MTLDARQLESKWVKAAQVGDTEAFDRLVMANQKRIFRALMRDCDNADLAADVMQDALIRAYRSLPSFRGDASFSTWFFRIARNMCWRRKQQMRTQETVSLDQPLTSEEADTLVRQIADFYAENPQDLLLEDEVRQHVQDAIGRLPSSLRTVLILRDMEGLSTQEAADQMGLTEAAVKARLHRARQALRVELESYFAP